MLNQKGQAFSVFELMIAGVVAFAILIVLMTVIGGLNFNPSADPIKAISDVLKNNGTSGSGITQQFELKPGTQIFSTNFQERTGLEAASILFCKKSDLSGNSSVVAESGRLTYSGKTSLQAKAEVFCEATADQAKTTLDSFEVDGTCDPSSYCGDAQPCCVVLVRKK